MSGDATHPAMMVVESHYHRLMVSVESMSAVMEKGMQFAERVGMQRDDHYHLFRSQDATAWITFSVVFAVLIVFDNCVLHRSHKALSVLTAALYTVFWILCAGMFCGYIYWRSGASSAFNWMSGYLLEWMLSFDNLFVFHLIFQSYATPDELKHKPLYWGICGAVFFRLLFLFIGEYLMHAMFFAHLLFGGFLVYTGINAAAADDDEEDPSKNPIVQWLSRTMPFVPAYDTKGAFFVKVPVSDNGQVLLHARESNIEENGEETVNYGSVDFLEIAQSRPSSQRYEWRATMLFLVVVCLEVSDILFAVDSVSAIVAQVPDLFLAYTSAVFAMLGLRATFFIVDELVRMFSLLKYGVAAVLVFIGIKLMLSKVLHIPPGIVLCILVSTLASSMVASTIYERNKGQRHLDEKSALCKST